MVPTARLEHCVLVKLTAFQYAKFVPLTEGSIYPPLTVQLLDPIFVQLPLRDEPAKLSLAGIPPFVYHDNCTQFAVR